MTARSSLAMAAIMGFALAGCAHYGGTAAPAPGGTTAPTPGGEAVARATAESGGGTGAFLGTVWRLEDLAGAGTVIEATLEFPEAGKVAGNGSCNRFSGTVVMIGDSLRFGPLPSTRMSCPEAVMNQEGAYLKALQGAERFTLEGSLLLISSKGMEKPLRFIRKEP